MVGRLQIKWQGLGSAVDETANLISASGSMRLAPPGVALLAGKGMIDQATFTLHNVDGRYSSLLTTGYLYANTQNGKAYQSPVYFDISVDGGSNYTRVFTGIMKIPSETAKTSKTPGTITIDARSREDLLLQRKLSTSQVSFAADYLAGKTESEIIAGWLVAAGLTSGDYELDAGLFVIPWSWLDEESPIEAAWTLAAACGGRFYMRHSDGKFIYENMQRWAKSQLGVATYGHGDFTGLEVKYSDANLYKTVAVDVVDMSIDATDVIWQLDNPLTVPASSSRTVVAELANPAYSISAPDYAASTSGGINLTADVDVTVTQYAQRLSILIENNHSTQAAIIKRLKFTGKLVKTDSSQQRSASSSNTFWNNVTERKREIRSNKYIQGEAQAGALVAWLRDAQDTPLLTMVLNNVRGAPRTAGDLVVVNTDVATYGQEIFLTSVAWRYSQAGFWQNVEGVARGELFPYINDSYPYFVIGTDKLGTSDPDRGRLMY